MTSRTATERLRLPAGLAGLAVLSIAVGWAAAGATGATAPSVLGDPGPFVRWGLVGAQTVSDLAAALTVGLLILAATALPVRDGLAHRPALLAASGAGTTWALAGIALLVFSYADAAGIPLTDPQFGPGVVSFAQHFDLGRELLVTTAIAAVVGLLAAGCTRVGSAGVLALLTLVALIPPALQGHATANANHETAVTALGLHLLGICVWVGGLTGLILLRWVPGQARLVGADLARTARRYSTLAGWSYAAVALSGVISAVIRLGSWSALWTSYGTVILLKTVLLLALGAAGWWHRRSTLAAADAGRSGAFLRLAGAEVALMGVAIGLGVALSRSFPPSGHGTLPADPAQALTGYPLPPAPTLARWFTQWQPDLLWLLVIGLLGAGYAAGLLRLRRRGDSWPLLRTLSWLTGLLLLGYVSCGGPIVYGRVQFSAHMVAHMMLTMVVPPFLVLAAPVTLALRTLTARTDGTRGPREWIQAVLGSRLLRVLVFPPVAAVLFAGSLIAFYYTGAFGLALTTHVGHELMFVHFLLVGYLFAYVLIGVDPGPHLSPYPFRLLMLFATMGFHAFFGVAVIQGTAVLQQPYFAALHRPWASNLLQDQQYGGSLAWAIGEVPTLVLALVLAVQWAMSEDRVARRYDRAADRDGDAELAAYNAMLARLSSRQRSVSRTR